MDYTMTKDGDMTVIDIKNVDENNFEKVWGIVNETIDKNENTTAEKEVDVKDIMISGEAIKDGARNGIDDFAMAAAIPGEDVKTQVEREAYYSTISSPEVNDNVITFNNIASRAITDDKALPPYKAMMKAATIACEYMWTQSKEREATVTGEELADMMRIGIRDFYNAWQSDAGNPQPWKADDMGKDKEFYNLAYEFISTSEEYPVYTAIKMTATIACEYMCRKAMKEDAPEIPKVSGLRNWP